ncbi:hypothetical protein CBD41_09835 [bacterium TMED181]|nr:hypothetical protein [Planctomycetota bacterium]OUW41961.1 MAG: hypothetical protein CBD41_09835 [bacterium TMED181]
MRFKSGLFPPFLSFLFLLFSAHTSLVIADSSIQHSNQNSLEDPFLWVEKLGSSDWIEREESAEKLLEAGEASVEALRTALTHPDLEVRERVRELLSVISPLKIRVDLVRLGKDRNASLVTPYQSIKSCSLDFKPGETRMNTIRTDHEERRFQISLRGNEAPYSVEVLFHGTSTSSMTGPPGKKLELGVPWVILTEDRVQSETVQGTAQTASEISTWVLLLSESYELSDPEESAEKRLINALVKSLASAPTPQQIIAAAQWSDIPEEYFRDSEESADPWLIAQMIRGNTDSIQRAAEIIELHMTGEDPLTTLVIDGLLPFAIDTDTEGASALFQQHCADLSPWSQHLLWSSLDRKLREGSLSQDHQKRLLESLIQPGSLAVLRWSDSHMSSMWSSLIRSIDKQVLNELLATNWAEIMGEDLSQSTGRIPLFFSALGYMTNRGVILETGWKTPLLDLLPTQYAEFALAILLGQDRLKNLEEEDWKQILKKIDQGLRLADTTISLRVRNSVKKLSEYEQIPEIHRQTFISNLVIGLDDFQSNQKSIIDQILTRYLGELPREKNMRRDETYWDRRSKKWQARLESPEVAEKKEPRWIELTVADVRLDGQNVNTLGLRRWIMPTDHRVHMLGDDGRDSSIYLENSAGGSIRFSGSMLLMLNRPTLTRWRTTWRNWIYRFSTARLGAESAMVRSNVLFQTLLIASEADAPEDGLIKEIPITWNDIDQFLIESLDPDSTTDLYMTTEVITTLRLKATLPRLIELWEEKPTVSLGRALLALGDDRGRDLLRETVMKSRSRLQRDTQKALEDLIGVGDPEILESVIQWIEDPDSSTFSSNESQLLMLIRYLDAWLTEHPDQQIIPEKRLIGALVYRTDNRNGRNTVIPMLRRQTGLDMGWWDTYSMTDMEERYQVQEEVGALWRAWWEKKSADF